MTHTLLAKPGAQNLIRLWVTTYFSILLSLKIPSPSCPAFWQKLFHLTWSCGSQLFLAILNTLRESHGCRNQHHLCNLLPAESVQSSSSPTPSPAQSRNIPPGPWTLPTEPSSHTWYSPGLLWQLHWCPWRRAARVTLKRSDKSWQPPHKVLDLSFQQAENLFRQEGSNRSDPQMCTSAPPTSKVLPIAITHWLFLVLLCGSGSVCTDASFDRAASLSFATGALNVLCK